MTRRVDDLFPRIASFSALEAAAQPAARSKRRKPGVAAFLANLETEVLRLEHALLSGTWRPGRYVDIAIRDPKPRMVSAAPFRDRVVHHALCAVIEPVFERGFIFDSYANRRGKGTHRAVARYERFRNRHRHVLRCDLYRYFPAVDHAILKTYVAATAEPTAFLGYVLLPDGRRRLPEANVHRFRGRLRSMRDRLRAGTTMPEKARPRIASWVAHARHANTRRLRRALLGGGPFDPAAPRLSGHPAPPPDRPGSLTGP